MTRARCALVLVSLGFAASLSAQDGPASTTATREGSSRVADVAQFFVGAGIGLAAHESGHLVFDAIFDAAPRVTHVHLGPIPFFAISHRENLTPRREFTISSAGFWVQEGTDEWLLTTRPHLRTEHAPLAKGVFVFNVLNSVGYSMVAFAKGGPAERDTRGMSLIGVDERAIGALILAPALLDAYRYFRPNARWAVWTSRLTKATSVLLLVK